MVVDPVTDGRTQGRGFENLAMWTRGVDTDLFRPDDPADLNLPRPIFMNVGRVAIEKNLEAFLSLDLPGTKVVIGDGPQENELQAQAILTPSSSVCMSGPRWPPTSRRPMCSSSRASQTRSGSCSSKPWPAACRLQRIR